MIAIDNLFRDISSGPPKKAALKKATEVNRLYDRLKKGTIKLLIPEHFETPTTSEKIMQSIPGRKHLRMSFEHQEQVSDDEKISTFTPDILTVHTMKIPKGYVPIKAVLHYKVYTNSEENLRINFKIGGKCITIKPVSEAQKTVLNNTATEHENYSLFDGDLEINLKDIPVDLVNKTNEMPFSIFLKATKHYTFNLLIGCNQEKTTTSYNWPKTSYNRLKDSYNKQQEAYEMKLREQQQYNEHSLFDMI